MVGTGSESRNVDQGLVLKVVSGLCTVSTSDGIVVCPMRGVFRIKGDELSVCAGDRVTISRDENGENPVVSQVGERKNLLIRPPLANIDQLVFVLSTCEPGPNLLLLDQFIAIAEYMSIEPVLAVTKLDLEKDSVLGRIYGEVGIPVVMVDYGEESSEGVENLRAMLGGKITAFTGNTGVGKSTLLNKLFPELELSTGEISRKLGRGRHTTRQVELFPLGEGSKEGYVADTPGFSTMELEQYIPLDKRDLAVCFREFVPYLGKCRFQDCAHMEESKCAVREAVELGKVSQERHDSYRTIYQRISKQNLWDTKNHGRKRPL